MFRGGLPFLLALMLALPFVSNNTSPASAQGVDENRLETTLLQSYFLSVDNFAGPADVGEGRKWARRR